MAESLTKTQLGDLSVALDTDGVIAAALIGSRATATARIGSDVDVAVWCDESLSHSQRLALRLRLLSAATSALGRDDVDLVVLNEAPPLLRHRALRHRRMLVDRDPVTRVRLEAESIIAYLDTASLRAELAAGQRHRIEEGRFGRS